MTDTQLDPLLSIVAIVAIIWFFFLMGFKRPVGSGWNTRSPEIKAAVLTALFLVGVLIVHAWQAVWGSASSLAFWGLIILLAIGLMFLTSRKKS